MTGREPGRIGAVVAAVPYAGDDLADLRRAFGDAPFVHLRADDPDLPAALAVTDVATRPEDRGTVATTQEGAP